MLHVRSNVLSQRLSSGRTASQCSVRTSPYITRNFCAGCPSVVELFRSEYCKPCPELTTLTLPPINQEIPCP
jgi:hypothetical protein